MAVVMMSRTAVPAAPQGSSPYLRLRLALEHFSCLPAEIVAPERPRFEQMVSRYAAIEQALLGHPLAAAHEPEAGVVMTALATLRQRFQDDADFQATLDHNQLDEQSLGRALRLELWSEAVLAALVAAAPQLSATDVALYYHLHPDEFVLAEQRLARHLLITINPELPGNSASDSRQRILRLRSELLRHPHKFAKLAARYSECPTALKEGMLGWVKPGLLFPELDAALFALAEGGLSLPLETSIGLHLVRCEAIKPARLLSLEQAQPAIERAHRERHKRRIVAELLA